MDFLSSADAHFVLDERGRLWRNGDELGSAWDGFLPTSIRVDWLNKKLLLFGQRIGEEKYKVLNCDFSE